MRGVASVWVAAHHLQWWERLVPCLGKKIGGEASGLCADLPIVCGPTHHHPRLPARRRNGRPHLRRIGRVPKPCTAVVPATHPGCASLTRLGHAVRGIGGRAFAPTIRRPAGRRSVVAELAERRANDDESAWTPQEL